MKIYPDNNILYQNLESYKDNRGELISVYRQVNGPFSEDRISKSYYNVIRGFHGDKITGKLCICLYGCIKLIAWNIEKKEKTEIYLEEYNLQSVYIPPKFLLAHQCLSNSCILLYKWTHYYSGPEKQWSVRYDDPTINAKWDLLNPILSKRDKEAKCLSDLNFNL